jgi:hypothetical protein
MLDSKSDLYRLEWEEAERLENVSTPLISKADETKRDRILSRDEQEKLLKACDDPVRAHLRPLISALAAAELEKAKKAHSLSPPSSAPRKIGAVADEERSRSQFNLRLRHAGLPKPHHKFKDHSRNCDFVWRQ